MQSIFGVLGPLEIRIGSKALPLGGRRQQKVPSAVLLNVGKVTPLRHLVDAVREEKPPNRRQTGAQHGVQPAGPPAVKWRLHPGGRGGVPTRPSRRCPGPRSVRATRRAGAPPHGCGRAIRLRADIGDRRGQADTLVTLAAAQQDHGYVNCARDTYHRALALYRDQLAALDGQLR